MKYLLTKPIFNNSLILLRLWLGFMMMYYSYEPLFINNMDGFADYLEKDLGFPMPLFFAYLGKGGEFFGGLLLFLGLFTRVGALLIMIVMSVAVFIASKGNILGGGALAFNYLMQAFIIFCFVPEQWGLNFIISKMKPSDRSEAT